MKLKGRTVGKNWRRQLCQHLGGYWGLAFLFVLGEKFSGGRNLDEVIQRNCTEHESPRTKDKGSKTWKTRCVSAKWMKRLKKKMVYNIKSPERSFF